MKTIPSLFILFTMFFSASSQGMDERPEVKMSKISIVSNGHQFGQIVNEHFNRHIHVGLNNLLEQDISKNGVNFLQKSSGQVLDVIFPQEPTQSDIQILYNTLKDYFLKGMR